MHKKEIDLDRKRNYELARSEMEKFIGQPLTQDIIQNIHGLLGEKIGYRVGFVFSEVRSPITKKKVYSSPNSGSFSMETLMQELLDWFDDANCPLEQAAGLHWGLVKIHPFYAGNGRIARLLVLLILRNHGYDDAMCRKLEEYIEVNRHDYYDSLDDGNGHYHYSASKNVSPRFVDYLKKGLGLD